MEEKNFTVYCHENKLNGKKYFGITKRDPKIRWRNGTAYKENGYFNNAIKKYGWDNFNHIILFNNLSKEIACQIEIYLISKYNTTKYENGYNKAIGGEHPSPTKETIKKMSIPIVQLDLDGLFLNKYYSSAQAQRENENFNSSCITNCCKGKQFIHKNFIFMYEKDYELLKKYESFMFNIDNINKFIKQEEEKRTKEIKIRKEKDAIYKGKNKISRLSKKVIRLSLSGEILGTWDGARIASRELKINNGLISACCKGDSKTTKDSIFIYYEEYIKMSKIDFQFFIKERSRKRGNRVIQLTIDGDFIREWENQEEASDFLKIKPCLISACCKGTNKTAGGFRWIQAKEYSEITTKVLKEEIKKEKDTRKIVQLTKDFEFIKLWDRQVDASKFYNIKPYPISACCKNKQHIAYGYRWMYYNDYIEKYGEII